MSDEQLFQHRTDLSGLHRAVVAIREEVAKVIVGQHQMVDLMIAGLLSNGHILIEGVPGVAKTLTAKLLARCLDIPFSRIQFTPDLMPSDVLGTSVFDPRSSAFEFRPGPIFSSMVLIDEINRSPAKTQSSLFEVMEERQVTIDGKTHRMQAPFMVVATQNPVEHEGTYRLPEAQLDRFLFKINVPYPNLEEEVNILRLNDKTLQTDQLAQVQKLLTAADIVSLQSQIRSIHVEEKLVRFIAAVVQETRNSKSVFLGASPRASLAIMMASKAIAGMAGRDFVTPDDIVFVVPAVLRHRLLLTPEKEMEGITTDEVIQGFIKSIEIPR
ncbi:MAG: MoxR family ATPase [Sphingobacteriales bacterium]|nr:MAG: MoxR family ATPase [Sphingobacteriales bacterium]